MLFFLFIPITLHSLYYSQDLSLWALGPLPHHLPNILVMCFCTFDIKERERERGEVLPVTSAHRNNGAIIAILIYGS